MELIDGEQLKRNILSDMRVELTEEFDRNFERKAFFTKRWKQRANPEAKGSLLLVMGTMRRSIRSEVRGSGVRFSSAVPYTAIHNEGGKGTKAVRAHSRRTRKGRSVTVRAHTRRFAMPKRQFIGDSKRTQEIIKGVVGSNLSDFDIQISKLFKP